MMSDLVRTRRTNATIHSSRTALSLMLLVAVSCAPPIGDESEATEAVAPASNDPYPLRIPGLATTHDAVTTMVNIFGEKETRLPAVV